LFTALRVGLDYETFRRTLELKQRRFRESREDSAVVHLQTAWRSLKLERKNPALFQASGLIFGRDAALRPSVGARLKASAAAPETNERF
jgi:hypothetical protein